MFERITFIFDPLHQFWEHEQMHRKISISLVILFLVNLFLIELKRQGLIPASYAGLIPANHFASVKVAFTVILVLEVISLIFTLPCSFSRSVGKQFEILSLILLRNAFKELSYFPEPIMFTGNEMAVLRILVDGFGALIIFALLGYYYKIQKQAQEASLKPIDLYGFVAAKKGISLVLLSVFIVMGLNNLYLSATGASNDDFFHSFYTVLIITDILIVLVAQCFQPTFFAMFRNSGYALSTLIIRIALAAPPFYNVGLGFAAIVVAICLTLTSQKLFPHATFANQ
jgi:hypothetical protein